MPSDIITNFWPYFCRGEVVKGFGRGSKELGIPTGECHAKKLDSSGSKCSFFTLRILRIRFGFTCCQFCSEKSYLTLTESGLS